MRKAATYDELMTLDRRVNKLPTMTTVNSIEEKMEEFTKLKVFLQF